MNPRTPGPRAGRFAQSRWVQGLIGSLVLLTLLASGAAFADASPTVVETASVPAATAPAGDDGIRIVDGAGEPVAAARLEVFARPATSGALAALDLELLAGESDESGRVDGRLPTLDGAVMIVDHPRFAPRVERVDGAPPSRLVLAPGRELAVAARAPEGRQVLAGRVCARWQTRLEELRRGRDFERCTPLGDDGTAALVGLPTSNEAEVRVEVQAEGFLPFVGKLAPRAEELLAELEPGVLIAGVVRDPDGDPVPDAVVRSTSGAETGSSGDGTFRVATRALPGAIEVEAPGFHPRTVTVIAAEKARDLVIGLEWCEQLRLQPITDGAREITAAEVFLERFRPPTTWTLSRHQAPVEDGELSLDLPGPGRYRLRLRVPAHRDARLAEFEVDRAGVVDLGAVVLERGAGVFGQIVDRGSGEPLAGVHLRLVPLGAAIIDQLRHGGAPSAISTDDGSFELAGLDAGRYELLMRRDGSARSAREIELERDQLRDLGTLELGPGTRVHGRVTNRAEEPRAGVRVRVFESSGQAIEPLSETATDGDGAFELRLEPGEYQVRVYQERLLLSQPIVVPEDDEHELDLRVSTTRLTGVAVRADEPVAGGLLTLVSAHDPGLRRGKALVHTGGAVDRATASIGLPESYLAVPVEADGSFAFDDAAPGPALATYHPPEGEASTREIVVPDRDQAWVRVELGGVELAGQVVDRDSELGLEATVRVLGTDGRVLARPRVDPNGHFVARDLDPAGEYAIEAGAPGYATAVTRGLRPATGAPPVVVALEPGADGELAVRLTRADGSPAAGAFVSLLDEAGSMLRSLPTDPAGSRIFDRLPAGAYHVVWTDPVAGTGISEPLRVGGEPARLDAVLAPGVGVEMRCSAENCAGRVLEALKIYSERGLEIGSFLPGLATAMRFSADGRLLLGRLTPGRYLLRTVLAGRVDDRLLSLDRGSVTVPIP